MPSTANYAGASDGMLEWLQAWHTTTVSLQNARQHWLSRQTASILHACQMLREQDLIACGRYAFSGHVPTLISSSPPATSTTPSEAAVLSERSPNTCTVSSAKGDNDQ